MQSDPNHPSQAEGEDPQGEDDGSVQPQDGHPPQAEGEDPDATRESQGDDT